MRLATDTPGLGRRKRVARTRQQPKGHTDMSARALAARRFEPVAVRAAAPERLAPEGLAAEIQFREDLWREYRNEAINAGFSPEQATEYASALSSELGLVAGVLPMAPLRRGWSYQGGAEVVRRTISSGLITLTRWEMSKTAGRARAADASALARAFRWWNAGAKS
jgi:hypothetical protein